MSVLDESDAVQVEHHRLSGWTHVAAIVVVGAAVAVGVYVAGALVTDDETIAKGLTGVWLAASGAAVLFVAWRWRPLAWTVIITYALVAGSLTGLLLYTSTVDRVVDEQVVQAGPATTGDDASSGPGSAADVNVQVASGDFVAQAHPTSGTATLIDTVDGGQVLTLTDFATDPGPDLRVYLVPAGAKGVDGGVDVGALKGNKGSQQYEVPQGAAGGTVVIWCRAFSVAFGQATLT